MTRGMIRKEPSGGSGRFLAGVGLAALVILALGTCYYQYEDARIHRNAHAFIAAVGKLKGEQIQKWTSERLADVSRLGGALALNGVFPGPAAAPGDKALESRLMRKLAFERDAKEYDDVLLFFSDGSRRLSTIGDSSPPDPATLRAIAQASTSSHPVLSDPFRSSDGSVSIDAVSVLRDSLTRPIAALILRSNTATSLQETIRSWPTPSRTAETLLVMREGDSVTFLSDTRFGGNRALFFRQSINDAQISSVKAVQGYQGILDGRDYRGVKVLANLGSVEGTRWFMVTKIDHDEVMAEAQYRGIVSGVVTLLLILGTVSGAFYLRQQQRNLHTQQAAEASLVLQSTALNAAANAIVITDRKGTIVWVNHAFSVMTGYRADEAIGATPRIVKSGAHDSRAYRQIWETILAGKVWHGEMSNRRKDGSAYSEFMTITPVQDAGGAITHFVAIKQDLTEEKQLQAQLAHAQKMEVVGRLAGGIAHDFNNLLTVINGTADLAARSIGEDNPLHPDLKEIRLAGLRAAALTRQLLAFSRRQIVKPEIFDLARAVRGMQEMIHRLLGEDIQVQVAVNSDQSMVTADQGQIEQVILNLAVNARDAMPQGGTLSITLDACVGGGGTELTHGLPSGEYVTLEVKDDGVGMSEETQRRIYEPFFTTKEAGKGTGLGLATVLSIVEQSGGQIRVNSALGKGTTFTAYFPRTTGQQASERPTESPGLSGGTETILLVEDQPQLRSLSTRLLRTLGFTVLPARNEAEAIGLAEKYPGAIDLLFTDVVLPGVGGRELARRIVQSRPEVLVLFTSGYTEDTILRHGILEDQVGFLAKPYTLEELAAKVRNVLDTSPVPQGAGGTGGDWTGR